MVTLYDQIDIPVFCVLTEEAVLPAAEGPWIQIVRNAALWNLPTWTQYCTAALEATARTQLLH